MRASTSTSASRALISRIVWAKWPAPPSGRSSRSTDVRTTYVNPRSAIGLAPFRGPAVPALRYVRAVGLLADRVQVARTQKGLQVGVVLPGRRAYAKPLGLA